MNLEIFLSEHSPENSLPQKGSFWAMSSPEKLEVSEESEQAVKDAVYKVFSENAPNANKIPEGVYFQVHFQGKCIFRGHINSSGHIDSIVKL